jgi:hypothetical protein
MLRELLFLLGEDLVLDSRLRDSGIDRQALDERLRLTPTQRLQLGFEEAERNIRKNPNRVRRD